MSTNSTLPHWDMTVVYPGIDSPAFEAGFAEYQGAVSSLAALFEQLEVGQRAPLPQPLDAETTLELEHVLGRMNAVMEQTQTLGAYINSFITTDSRDNAAQAALSRFQRETMSLTQLQTRLTAWIGSLDVDALVAQSDAAREHELMLRKAALEATHLLSPAEEDLVAELNLSAGAGWIKLHGNLTSQINVTVPEIGPDGKPLTMPMSAVRNLAYDADRNVRRHAHEAELAAWEAHALPLAAAMNGIKGQVNTLARRRGWESPLDEALFQNNIDRGTLEAMLEAARESFPDFRRYLRAKAHALGLERLAWYDMFAPLGGSTRVWDWGEAEAFIIRVFSSYTPEMGAFASRAFRERWIDAEPRPGKRDGAFCMPLRADESRILSNFKPAFAGVSTLAHELGHGYHNVQRSRRTMLQRTTPMALAETASIFCETIIRDVGLRESDAAEQLAILEASLQGSCQVVVDITSRFLFEQAVFDRRRERESSIDELNELMLQAQRDTYGDGLHEAVLHPFMWAVKGHYYSTGRSFYNYPYMFGLLFALGLYARYQQEPETFPARYDELLASTGLADAATLANRFGIDIRTPEFWRESLAVIRADIDRFEALTG